jgi:hypothetical protein
MTKKRDRDLRKEFSKGAKLEMGDDGAYITRKEWIKDGERHRVDGPCTIEWDAVTGIVIYEEWMQHGEFHRLDGPAIVERNGETGEIRRAEWWIEGKEIKSRRLGRE